MSSDELTNIKQKSTFDMIPLEIRKTVDIKYTGLLSMIASLTFQNGYCNASDDTLISKAYGITKKRLLNQLDWLDDNGFTIRYNMDMKLENNEFKTRRLITLSNHVYNAYKNINPKMHEPIECPKGFLPHKEYLKRRKKKREQNKSTKQHATNRDAKLIDKQTEHLNPFADDVADNTSEELKQQKQPENEHIEQSKDDASSMNAFLNNQGIETKNDSNRHPPKEQPKQRFSNDKRNELFAKLCTYYQQKGYEDYVARATEKLEKMEQQAK